LQELFIFGGAVSVKPAVFRIAANTGDFRMGFFAGQEKSVSLFCERFGL
jgi:hypothetical protein